MATCNLITSPARGRLRRGLIAAMAIVTLSSATRSDAGFVISVADVTATAGSSGSFDVLISNTNSPGGASYSVGSDVLQLALTGISGVTFTGVTIDTTTPYIYLTSGTTQGGGPLSFDNFPNTGFTASDSEFSPLDSFQRTIAAGMSFGLANVSYTVAAGTAPSSGLIAIVVNADGSATSLADAFGNNVPFTTLDGSFTVTSSVVPEPSTIFLTATGFPLALVLFGQGRARSIRVGRGKTQHSEEAR